MGRRHDGWWLLGAALLWPAGAEAQPAPAPEAPAAPAPAPAPATPPVAPAPATPVAPAPGAPPAAPAPYPYPYPYPQPWPPYPGSVPGGQPVGRPAGVSPEAPATPPPPEDDREMKWFARFEMGFGGRGLLDNNRLLTEVGYASFKFWAGFDGAYMVHPRIGIGGFLGMNRRASDPEEPTRAINIYSFFGGAQAPIHLWGERAYTFHITPRLGFLGGSVSSEDLSFNNTDEGSAQYTAIFGALASFQSFTYHVGASAGWLFAPAGRPGEAGRPHDFGGLFLGINATLDGDD